MDKITFVIPSRNNLEFLKLAYKSIRNLKTKHEILVLDDASEDQTYKWLKSLKDDDLIIYRNKGPGRIGIVGMFDKGIEMATTDIIMAFHADMVVCDDFDVNILKHLKKGTVVTGTRVEPPLHPPGPEKLTMDFGKEVDEFNMDSWLKVSNAMKEDKTTEGIFAPWCMYKEDFLSIGGHDELFAPQSKEDSDLFNRFHLKGYKFVQPWDALVYHFTSRGSRFNKYAGGSAGVNSPEWIDTTTRNTRNFIRKWGTMVQHDSLMKPIVSPKYNIGIVVETCNLELLRALEPWCDKIYIEDEMEVIKIAYLETEKTSHNLNEKIVSNYSPKYPNQPKEEIIVNLDKKTFSQMDYDFIQQLPLIIKDTGEIGTFELGNLKITINKMTEYQDTLINLNNS